MYKFIDFKCFGIFYLIFWAKIAINYLPLQTGKSIVN